jgi:hypothetical protein
LAPLRRWHTPDQGRGGDGWIGGAAWLLLLLPLPLLSLLRGEVVVLLLLMLLLLLLEALVR